MAAFAGVNGVRVQVPIEGDNWRVSVVMTPRMIELGQLTTRDGGQLFPFEGIEVPQPWDLRDAQPVLGNSFYMPIADGARFHLNVTRSGVIVCPANDVARSAWHNSESYAQHQRAQHQPDCLE